MNFMGMEDREVTAAEDEDSEPFSSCTALNSSGTWDQRKYLLFKSLKSLNKVFCNWRQHIIHYCAIYLSFDVWKI